MFGSLPARANLTHLKHQAKAIIKAHRRGRPEACSTLRHLRRFAKASDEQILASAVALHDAQYALAMQYGFRSWSDLKHHVQSVGATSLAQGLSLVASQSLAATIDAVNDAFFFTRDLNNSRRRDAAEFIAGRQGLPGSYANMFAPTEKDNTEGFRLFTGERLVPGGGASHILGEEACRCLMLLGVRSASVTRALTSATHGTVDRMTCNYGKPSPRKVSSPRNLPGMFCCMKCTCALWRYAATRQTEYEEYLVAGLKALHAHRDGKGAWMAWPFHYTLLVLIEMDGALALAELQYAAKRCKLELKNRFSKTNVYSLRRRAVMERVLAKC